jgi:hypothetical protein
MENQVIDLVRSLLIKVVSYDRIRLVDALNATGFPITTNDDEETLINTTLSAMQVSEKFRDDLAQLMLPYADVTYSQTSTMNESVERLIQRMVKQIKQ